jgi:hypothetical protein
MLPANSTYKKVSQTLSPFNSFYIPLARWGGTYIYIYIYIYIYYPLDPCLLSEGLGKGIRDAFHKQIASLAMA